MAYIKKICSTLSELINVILGGYQHETICVRIWRTFPNTKFSRLIDRLFVLDKRHCRNAYLYNALKKETAKEIEDKFKNIKNFCI